MGAPPTDRRRFLRIGSALVTGGLAGCVASRNDDGAGGEAAGETGTGTAPATSGTTRTHTATRVRSTEPSSPEPAPIETPSGRSTATAATVEPPFRFEVGVERSDPTVETPPVVRTSVTHVGDQPRPLTFPGLDPPTTKAIGVDTSASEAVNANDENGLLLVDTDAGRRDSACWSAPRIFHAIRGTRTFRPGESAQRRHHVVNVRDTEDGVAECWPTGTFEFAWGYTRYPAVATPTTGGAVHPDEGTAFEWGFRLRVDERSSVRLAPEQPFAD